MTGQEHPGREVRRVVRAGVQAWLACMERREEAAYDCLMSHVRGCGRCTAAVDRGGLLDPGELCGQGSALLVVWDAGEDAIAAAIVPAAAVA